jgi:small subunit ribosomal protein S20
MANIKSAKKRIQVIEKKTQRNRRVKSHLKEVLKDLETAIVSRDKETARDKLALAEKRLMQAASKGTIHKNTASRKISRITAGFKTAFGQEALLEKANKPAIAPKKKAIAPAKTEAPVEAAVTTEEAAEETPADEVVEVAVEEKTDEAPAEQTEKKPAAKRKSTKKASVEEADKTENAEAVAEAEPVASEAEAEPAEDEKPEA